MPEHRLYASLTHSTDMTSSNSITYAEGCVHASESTGAAQQAHTPLKVVPLSAGVRAGQRQRECMSRAKRTPLTERDRLQWLEEGPRY